MPDKNPLVSVITPSYNQGHFIKKTIDSILSQSYSNIEYIVVDGGSTDQTIDILRSYGDKIHWISEPDKGQSDALNKGIAMANGKIIGWLNSDDLYLPDAVRTAVTFLTENPEYELVYGNGHIIDLYDNITRPCPDVIPFNYKALAERCIICQAATFFTKSLFDKVGGINQNLQYCMDYDLWIRMAKFVKFMYLPIYLASFRIYDDNKTTSKNFDMVKESIDVVKKYYNFVHPRWIFSYITHLYCGVKIFNLKFWFSFCYYLLLFNNTNLFYVFSLPFRISSYKLIGEFLKKVILNINKLDKISLKKFNHNK
ncbi:MAG: glycosyltransferase [Deltaproteobacteria bacterium]|jgi:glycosyltransferase involved in cell wall biosynthesis|nr:glycosyltransferase [Deltaproteobacteria bacterium]